MERVGGRLLRVARWRWNEGLTKPPLLFLNGIGANAEAVEPFADLFPDRPFITYDQPGSGGSPSPVIPYNAFQVAWQTGRVLQRFGVDQADVMGISWGGAMAQQFALQHPSRVRRLVLAATNAGLIAVPGNPVALGKLASPKTYSGNPAVKLQPPSARGFLYQCLALAGWTSAPALPLLKKPTLILTGDKDRIVPPINARLLHRLIPGSELEVFPGSGHMFLMSRMAEVAARVHAFLEVD